MNLSANCSKTSSDNHRISKFSPKNEREILKIFLLERLYQLFCEFFQTKKSFRKNNLLMEYHTMDSNVIQLLIRGILETEEYTLEGIAYHTQIPFDVIYDAACGINNKFSITPWARIVDLYLKVKPDFTQLLVNKLLEIKDQNGNGFSILLKEV